MDSQNELDFADMVMLVINDFKAHGWAVDFDDRTGHIIVEKNNKEWLIGIGKRNVPEFIC